MSIRHQKWFLLLWCFCLSLLYLILHAYMIGGLQQTPGKKKTVSVRTVHREHAPQRHTRKNERLADFQNTDFYHTIIDNNLFRPLGSTLPVPGEPYRLLGTILPRDADTPPTAILQTIAGDTTHLVTVGDKIDASTEVVSIEGKQVTLSTNRQKRTLHLPSGF